MAFIDNGSGDIILDAVLTDLGRELLARGDGSFKITHFGLGDDEINYALWDATAATETAGASIKQLPVFEALTTNAVALKHRLLNIYKNNLLYMPILKLNELGDGNKRTTSGYFAFCVDEDTEKEVISTGGSIQGVLQAANPNDQPTAYVRVDQGLDTNEISFKDALSAGLLETDYQVKLDNRFGNIVDISGAGLSISQIDENNIAAYEVSLGDDMAVELEAANLSAVVPINNTTDSKFEVIAGPRGTSLRFKIRASDQLQYSTALFTKLGGTMAGSTLRAASTATLYYIDTLVRIQGSVTGYSIDIPVRFLKKV